MPLAVRKQLKCFFIHYGTNEIVKATCGGSALLMARAEEAPPHIALNPSRPLFIICISGSVWLASLISRLRAAADAACLLLVGVGCVAGGSSAALAGKQAGNQVCNASFDACAAPPLTKSGLRNRRPRASRRRTVHIFCAGVTESGVSDTLVASICD